MMRLPTNGGSASSPIIYKDLAIVQCDTQGEDFLLAVDIKTGEQRWRTARDEQPLMGHTHCVPGPQMSIQRSWLLTDPTSLLATIQIQVENVGGWGEAPTSPRPPQSQLVTTGW